MPVARRQVGRGPRGIVVSFEDRELSLREASYNLGRVYAARGQHDLAVREWQRALTVDPKHDAAKQALAHVGTEETIVVRKSSNRSAEPRPAKAPAAAPKTAPAVAPASKALVLDPRVMTICSALAARQNAARCRKQWKTINAC
jgi:tetratricopeptide (TPR) repeat protein